MLHTFVALVEDKTGLLARVTSLFRRLNMNIISLTVGGTETVGVSRMTIVAKRPKIMLRASWRLCTSWKDVLDVDDVGRHSAVIRELAMIESRRRPKHALRSV